MNTRLNHIQNWSELAIEVNWSASGLAKKCKVSVRTLERHFLKNLGAVPKAWLTQHRLKCAMELLREGFTVKETAFRLSYKHPHHFSRVFKGYWGYGPASLPLSSNPNEEIYRISV